MDDKNDSYYLKRNNELLEWVTETLEKWTGTKPTEKILLESVPFQLECKCDAGGYQPNGKLIIHHCQYHRSIGYIHKELAELIDNMFSFAEDEDKMPVDSLFGEYAEIVRSVKDNLTFLDECKKNSLTGEIGKARDENMGR